MDFEISLSDGYALVSLRGAFSNQDTLELQPRINRFCVEHNVWKVLVDVTGVQGEITVLRRYQVGAGLAQAANRNTRVAILATRAQKLDDAFFESVVRNRGLEWRIFVDRAEALGWLIGGVSTSMQF